MLDGRLNTTISGGFGKPAGTLGGGGIANDSPRPYAD
jgi:hypothetical protein